MKTLKNSILLILSLIVFQATAASSELKIKIEGAGIKSIRPSGFSYPRIGTYLRDDTGLAAILVTAAPTANYNPENDKEYLKYSYPSLPVKFSNGNLVGQLYKRSRAGNVGEWDATWLSVNHSGMQLSVTVSFNGPAEQSREFFARAQPFLDHLEWDENKMDNEVAFGARMKIPGLLPVKKIIGTLVYNKNGVTGNSYPNIMINTIPLPRRINPTEFSQLCTHSLNRTFSGRKYTGPYTNNKNGVKLCDGWGSDLHGNLMYIGVARLPSGDLINAIGYIPDTMTDFKVISFRDGILNVKLLR